MLFNPESLPGAFGRALLRPRALFYDLQAGTDRATCLYQL